MATHIRKTSAALAAVAALSLVAPMHRAVAAEDAGADAAAKPQKHHSKAKGAVVGGLGGAAVGGKKGAAVGAAGGALYQHHRNKKAAKEQSKAARQGRSGS